MLHSVDQSSDKTYQIEFLDSKDKSPFKVLKKIADLNPDETVQIFLLLLDTFMMFFVPVGNAYVGQERLY